MKKSYILILVILLALLISGLWVLKSSHKSTESMPAEEQIEFVEQETVQSGEVKNEADSAKKVDVTLSEQYKTTVNTVKDEVKTTGEQAAEVKDAADAVTKTTVKKKRIRKSARKSSPSEEEELLQKTPPAKEIVVDKEIKVRKVGKYVFK